MKIAIVVLSHVRWSGVVATELGLELARQGHRVHFITYSQPVRLALLNPNVHYHEVMFQNTLYFNINHTNWPCPANWWIWSSYKIEILHVLCYSSPMPDMAKQMLKMRVLKFLWSRHFTVRTSPWLGITLL
jgi:hypothetical protein